MQISKQIARLREQTERSEKKKGRKSRGIRRVADLLVFLVGPPGSGKSQVLRLWTGLQGDRNDGVADMGGMKVQVVEIPSVVPGQPPRGLPVLPDAFLVILTHDYPDAGATLSAFGPSAAKIPSIAISKDGISRSMVVKSRDDLAKLEAELVRITGVTRVYLKSPQEKLHDSRPLVFRGDVTVGQVAEAVHRSLARNFKYARVWGSVHFQGEKVGKGHRLSDGDVVELHGARVLTQSLGDLFVLQISVYVTCCPSRLNAGCHIVAKKRKSRGRGKGSKGKAKLVQCDNCGAWVPRDKIVRVTRWISPVDPQLEKELKAKGAIVPKVPITKNYCISCAVHMGLRAVRSRKERKEPYTRI